MTTGDAPITQSGISPLVSLVSRDAQLSQVGHLCFGLLPLLPDVHSESASHFAVIDQEVVWYGSTNLLSRDKDDDSLMRICSMDVALELLEETGR